MRRHHKTTFSKKIMYILIYIFSPLDIVKSVPYDLDEDAELIAEKMVDDFNIPGIMEQDTTSITRIFSHKEPDGELKYQIV